MSGIRDVSNIASERRRTRRFGFVVLAILFIAFLALAVTWIVLRSGLFWAKKVTITGNNIVSEDQVLSLLKSRVFHDSFVKYLLGYRNMLIWPKEISGEDLRLLPQVKKMTVEISYAKRAIAIRVEERNRRGIWCFVPPGGERLCWWFDDEGFLTERVAGATGSLILVVQDYAETPKLFDGSYVLPKENLANLLSVMKLIQSIDISVTETAINKDALEEVRVTTENGPVLYFSLRFPIVGGEAAIASLREKTNFEKLRSIDFRVQNRVYYR